MVQTARNIVTDTAETAASRKRTRKPLRAVGHYKGNLAAFTEPQLPERAKTPASLRLRMARKAHPQEPVAPGSQAQARAHASPGLSTPAVPVVKPEASPVPGRPDTVSVDSPDTIQPRPQVVTNNDTNKATTVTANTSGLLPLTRRNKVAAAVLVALTTGAVVGSLWTSKELKQEFAENAQEEQLAMPPLAADTAPEPDSALLPDTLPVISGMDPIIKELEETRRLADGYLEEIDWLHAQNEFLQEQVDVLDSETIELNRELLEVELALAALESESQPQVETRTVYNFVNVPIGADINTFQSSSETWQDSGVNDQYPTEYDNDNFMERNFDEDGFGPEGFASDEYEDDIYAGDAYADEGYLDELFEDEMGDLPPIDEQLIYDPETGFYIDPRYDLTEEEFFSGQNNDLEYPPIGDEIPPRQGN